MIERKCLACGQWNQSENRCTNCNNPISPEEITRVEEKIKLEIERNIPKTNFELFVERMKNHRYLFVRIIYKISYSITLVFAAIGGFFAWMIAMANG